jgi:precorrin-2/cobalt-factor-2 C20-methyltransferase
MDIQPTPGILYGVGVGPGDPELLTLKAARLLRETPVIAAPVTHLEAESYALSVVASHLQPQQKVLKLHFPMLKDVAAKAGYRRAAAQAIAGELQAGRDVVFLTEGDPLLHSTFIYIVHDLPDGLLVEFIPGVSSITAAAAQAGLPLVYADQRLAVIPATFEQVAELKPILASFDTIVLLKVNRVFDRLLDLLEELGLTDRAVLVERASHPGARVIRDVGSLRGRSFHYLSLLIIYKGGFREDRARLQAK